MFCEYPQGTSAQQPSSEAKRIGYHTGGFVSTLLAFHDDCENRFRQALGRLVGPWEIGKYTYDISTSGPEKIRQGSCSRVCARGF